MMRIMGKILEKLKKKLLGIWHLTDDELTYAETALKCLFGIDE